MEIILDYFVAAINAILAIFGKDAIEINKENGFLENIKSMLVGLGNYKEEVTDAGIDL